MQYIIQYIDLGNEIDYLEIHINHQIIIFINTYFYTKKIRIL